MYQNFIGIDIGKFEFVVALHGQKSTKSFQNNKEGIKAFYQKFKDELNTGLSILETTGGYEKAVLHFLLKKKCHVHRANAMKVKYFIQSMGTLAKTDALDAHGLALYGFERHSRLPLYKAPPKANMLLMQLLQRRIDLNKLLVAEKNRAQAPGIEVFVKKSCQSLIKQVQEQIHLIDEQIQAQFDSMPLEQEKISVLQEIKGIGDVISKSLLILLPELGRTNRRCIASLAGLAPHPYESGQKFGVRRIKGGRSDVRNVLFMAAMSAARSKGKLGEYYDSLIARGKKKMVALTALMRKILVIANAKLRVWYQAQENHMLAAA